MGILIGIVGSSGSGKSTSIEGLDPKKTVIINVAGKILPFKGWKSNYIKEPLSKGGNLIETDDASQIVKALQYISENRPEITEIVVEDSQYIMSFEFMRRAKERGFDKFTDIAENTFKILNSVKSIRSDLKVYFLWHDETIQENGVIKRKMKTIGRLIDDKITLEGLFTIVLFTEVKLGDDKKPKYFFITQTDGTTTAKSPKEMFEDLLIPNNLGYISNKINEYYN